MTTTEIEKRLFELQDCKYRLFQAKLVPNISQEKIIGVRNPILRSFAKTLYNDGGYEEFLNTLPHKYYDEDNLHGYLVSLFSDYGKTIKYIDELLPYVSNWATCDLISPKSFKKNKELLLKDISRWLSSDKTYTIRFGIEMLMSHFLDDDFKTEYLEMVAKIKSEEYYVNMMIAWFFATALAKQYESTLPYIENHKLDKWVNNKTIQKALESYRITDSQKTYLRKLKV